VSVSASQLERKLALPLPLCTLGSVSWTGDTQEDGEREKGNLLKGGGGVGVD
jgi:hypothetical protein